MYSEPDLRINLIPISFCKGKFVGGELLYTDENQLKELRELHKETHVIMRSGNKIKCVSMTENTGLLGKEKEFNVDNDFTFASRLVQESIIRFLKSNGMKFSKMFNPTSIIITRENLMQDVVDADIAGMLPMYPEYQFESRVLIPHGKKMKFGILLDFNISQLIEATALELIRKGVDIRGRYVVAEDRERQTPIDSMFKKSLVGRVKDIEGQLLRLDDYKDKDHIEAESCYLEASTSNLRECLTILSGKNIEQIQSKKLEKIFKVKGAKNQLERIEKIRVWLANHQPFHCGGGLSFEIASDILGIIKGNEAGEYYTLRTPSFVLRPGGSITVDGNVDKKIDEKGPYDTESFPKKRIKVVVLYPERFKGEVEVFFRQFHDGVPQRQEKYSPFTQGFIRKYHLSSCDFVMRPIPSDKEDSIGYKQASLKALEGNNYDLAMIVIREDFHKLYGESNPYLVSKSAFMSQGVPVQSVEIETIKDQRGRPWILNNIGIATYAKLGGIPYVLSSAPGLTHELIFGIGSFNVKSKRLADSERFIGITTVFNGDGNYLLYNLTKEVLSENYKEALLESLKDAIEEVKARYAWQKGDSIRLIFHQSFKKFKDEEAQAVKDLVDSMTDFQVEYAFVHISTSHPWKVYDKNSKGSDHWENYKRTMKGEFVPFRGLCIPLGPQTGMLTLTGPPQLKTPLQGCPEPILVSLHRESTFRSWEYLAAQVFKLTFMSWRSFFPSSKPVTIEYSDFIARMMGSLRDISNWNPDILSTKLRESRWFL